MREEKDMKNHYKKLICSFVAVVLVGVIGFAGLNFFVDPFGYFRLSEGFITNLESIGIPAGARNTRLEAVCALKNTLRSDFYQGLIVGGSKSEVITAELMQTYTGIKYIGCVAMYGEFEYYEKIIRFALQHQQLQHIVLHLSGIEIWENPPSGGIETYRTPDTITTQMDSGYSLKDTLYYLFADANNAVNSLWSGSAPGFGQRFSIQPVPEDRYSPFRSENQTLSQQVGISDLMDESNISAGTARISMAKVIPFYYRDVREIEEKNTWANNNVLNAYGIPYNSQLAQLFVAKKDLINKNKNIEHLRNIINLCNVYNVEFTLILGSTFLIERGSYECPEYWDYLHQIAQLTDFYDFSYFCDINMNPYNFIDPTHNLDFVAIVMIDNLYGDGVIPFGQKVTAENFDEYIAQRQSDYYALEREYMETGTVQLPGAGDESDLSAIPGEFWLEMLSRAEKNAA